MVTRDPKKLLQRLNQHCTHALEAAAGFCISRSHYEVSLEHLMLKLLEDGTGDLPHIFDHFGVDGGDVWEVLLARLEAHRTGNTGRPTFSPPLLELVESAWVVASVHHGYDWIRSGHLLEALLESDAFRMSEVVEALASVQSGELRKHVVDIVGGSAEDRPAPGATDRKTSRAPAREGETALDLYTMDVTGRARDGAIDPVFARDNEIRQIIDVLSRRRKNNPILVGEAGVGKTAVVEGLALRIADGDVPESLAEVEIRTLDLGLLQAGAGVKGEFENRLKSVIQEVREAPRPTILFIDEAHTLIGAGGAAGTSDAANLLKPALARGELRTIAATTWSEFKKYIEKDPALERRFQMVKIDEPSAADTSIMLRGLRTKYEEHHDVQVTAEAVEAAALLSDRYIAGRQLPDKAVDLMDTASARVKMTQSARPAALDDVERRLLNLRINIDALRRDLETGLRSDGDTLKVLEEESRTAEAEKETLEARWEQERGVVLQIVSLRRKIGDHLKGNGQASDGSKLSSDQATGDRAGDRTGEQASGDTDDQTGEHASDQAGEQVSDETYDQAGEHASDQAGEPTFDLTGIRAHLDRLKEELTSLKGDGEALVHAEVNADIVARVVSDWTGIPIGNMLKDEAGLLLELEDRLRESIRGQDEAIEEVSDSIRAAKAGMGNPDAPIAVFLMVGPSGIGKTETARTLARLLFGGERFLTTINMSEYQESHTVSQLKGSPPGYVGYGEGGVLTEAVRRRPYSVVLLDEVEKAHKDVMELFYQVFDRGSMRDGEGREVGFRNTVIIMTSNIASDLFLEFCNDEERPTPDQLRQAIHPQLVQHFQSALLGRMKVVPFYPLQKEAMKQITRLKLGKIDRRLREAHAMTFEFGDEVVERIAERCTQIDTGARNIDFIIDRTVLPQASKVLLARMADEKMPERLTLGMDEEGNFTYTSDGAVAALHGDGL